MSSKYTKLASDIIENVGGKGNVKDLKHCVTRLRFTLKDESKANDEVLKNMKGVVTVVKSIGQYMVVIGEHVPYVYDEVCLQLGFTNKDSSVENKTDEKKKLDKVLSVIMKIMGPTLNLLCACGIIKGIAILTLTFGLSTQSSIYMLLNAAGDSLFYCFPLVLGYNTAKHANIDPYFGLLFGAALIYPTIQGVDLNLFGFTVNATYTSSFLPVIFGLLVAIPVYKFLDKHLPMVIKGFMTPLITLLICFPLTFAFIGPFATLIGKGISVAINFLFDTYPIIAGVLLGGFWQVLVMFGIHGVLITFAFYDLIAGTPSAIIAISSIPCYAVAGALLAIAIKTKSDNLKGIGISAFISSIFGVTEPGMYGVIVPRKKIFISTCIAGAAGGLIIGITKLKMYTYAGMGLIGTLGLINPGKPNFFAIGLAMIVPFAISFMLTMTVFKDNNDEKTDSKDNIVSNKEKSYKISMPINGIIQPLKQCSDHAFAQETLGKGCLIIPEDNNVYAPIKGTVQTLFPTKHAIGIVGENGVEILIHIGINTVNLEGRYFDAKIKQGDKVDLGQCLVSFDKSKIEEEGYSTETIMIVTNTSDYLDVVEVDHDKHNHGDTALKIIL